VNGSSNPRKKLPREAGTTILFQPQLRAAEATLEKMGVPLPPSRELRRRFFTMCSVVAFSPRAFGGFDWILKDYPDAFCYTVLKLREAMRETEWSIEGRRLQKPRRAISREQQEAAMQYRPTGKPGDKQTKAEENAAREMRRRAAQP
jgi:hypothetical protein